MPTTMSSREFNQDASRAKRAAKSGPVFITDRGQPQHVLLSIEEYRRLTERRRITDVLATPDADSVALPRQRPSLVRARPFLIDVSARYDVISELRKARTGTANQGVLDWADGVDANAQFISAITVLEFEQGVMLVERRDARPGAVLRAWLGGQVLPESATRTLPIDVDVARRCAALHVPDPRSERDELIAATALVHGLVVVTGNVTDFDRKGVRLVSPWSHSGA